MKSTTIDKRREIIYPGDREQTIAFCAAQFISLAQEAIQKQGYFAVALSGGSTPQAIFQLLAKPPYRNQLDWTHVWLFWGDERCVPKDHPDSNYHMAMEAGFKTLPLLPEHIFPMPTEGDLQADALAYEQLIISKLPKRAFDLVMLGMGEDGHTASLFPHTQGLHVEDRLVIANFIPNKNVWRMTLTFPCINAAEHIVIYVLGSSKEGMLKRVLSKPYEPDLLPAQRLGTIQHKALWIKDRSPN